ncbi:MAG: DUF1365 domain-containing protein [Holosporales bacterium]
MALPAPCLYRGILMHKRVQPIVHRFQYRVASLFIRLDNTKQLPWPLSIGAQTHGARDGMPLIPWLDEQAKTAGITESLVFYIHCFPHLFGMGFDPLSVYFGYDAQKQELRFILYEVKNREGGQHCYPVVLENPETTHKHSADKVFYVSPFLEMDCSYFFRTESPGETFSLFIRQQRGGKDIFFATHNAYRSPLSRWALLRLLPSILVQPIKIVGLIYGHALYLRLRGLMYLKPPLAKL